MGVILGQRCLSTDHKRENTNGASVSVWGEFSPHAVVYTGEGRKDHTGK